MNSREQIGGNNPPVEYTPESLLAKATRDLVRELNQCANERKTLVEEEKELKDAVKAKGLSPRALAIGNRARKSKKEDPTEVLEAASRFIYADEFESDRSSLNSIAEAKKDISRRERELRAAAREQGVVVETMPVIRKMQQMDSIERQEYFDAICVQSQALRFW